jgi:hypothetical protein
MMDYKNILNLAERAAQGFDNFKVGSVGCNGYGFVFRDLSFPFSRKLCNFGSMGEFAKDLSRAKFNSRNLQSYNITQDILLIGSIKTLTPSLEIGGDEILFSVWMFVVTADGRTFPTRLYYGPSRLAIGGWKLEGHKWFSSEVGVLEELNKTINCDPFTLSSIIKRDFVKALELAIKKVSPSDFCAIYEHDLGFRLMGINNGAPLCVELGESPSVSDIKMSVSSFFEVELDQGVYEKWDFH